MASVLVLVLLAGCQLATAKSERVRGDWSRGEKLGQAIINQPPALATDAAGQVFVLWVGEAPNEGLDEAARVMRQHALHLAHLDESGRLILWRELPIQVERPTDVQILAGRLGYLHILWLDRLDGVIHLFHAGIQPDGGLLSEPERITLPSRADAGVDSFAVGMDPEGQLDLLLAVPEAGEAGLYHARLDAHGALLSESQRIHTAGHEPALRYGRDGRMHVIWMETPDYGERQIYYAPFDRTARALGEAVLLDAFSLPLGLVAQRPALGLIRDRGQVFWSIERRGGGLTSPAAWAYWLSFPLDEPQAVSQRQPVLIPDSLHPPLASMRSAFQIEQLASASPDAPSARFIYMPTTNEGHLDELAVAFAAQLSGRTRSTIQIALTLWEPQALRGYQIAARTNTSSLNPALLMDRNRNLHLAWIDTAGFGAFDVYYASTADAVVAELNRVTPQDVAASILTFLWGVAQSLSFLPLALVWMFVPVLLMVVYVMVRAEGRLDHQGPRAILILGIGLYVIFKYLFQPNWLAALPLPYGMAGPAADVVLFATPFVISGVAGVCTWLYARRHETASMFSGFAMFAVCDALLTVLIYVPGILAE
ncbi:MAG: hypothetical protein JXA74_09160 [Anaerolineae bacterium]|nr:hypothetical protein [Anaerolineae bacterium]